MKKRLKKKKKLELEIKELEKKKQLLIEACEFQAKLSVKLHKRKTRLNIRTR